MLTTAMGVTAPTLYSAFGSKEQLYGEVLEVYRRGPAGERSDQAGALTARATMEAFLTGSTVRFTASDRGRGCMMFIGAIQSGPESAGAARATSAARQAALEQIVALFDVAKSKGELSPGTDVRGLARFYLAVIQGMAVQAADGASQSELETLVAMAMAAWPQQP